MTVQTIVFLTVCMRAAGVLAIMTTQTAIYMYMQYVTNIWSANHGTVNAYVFYVSV